MKTFNNLFLPKFFFTPSVFVLMFLWTTYTHFLDFTNNTSTEYLLRFAIVLIVFLVAIIFLAFAYLLFFKVDQKYQPYLLLISLLLAAAFRGYLLDLLLNRFIVEFELRPAFRISSSLFNFTMSGLLATLAFGKVREHSTSLYTLVREQNRLSFVEKVTKENLQEFDQTQVKPIKDQLLGRLQTIRTQDFDQALFTIRQTIDEIVQPLSRNLDEQISQWSPPDFDLKESKIDWKKAARQAAIVKEIDPKIIPLIISLIGIPTIVSNYGIQIGTIILVQSVLTGYFLYLVTKTVFSKLANNTFGFVLSLLIAGFMQAALSLIWSYRIDSSLGILLIAPGAALVVGFLVAIVNTASRQLNEVRLNISQTTADLSWAVSRIRNEQHQRSRNLGRKLHGEIQARFSSAFLMLQNSQNNPETTKSLINEIADNLEKDVLKLDEPNSNVQKLDEVLDNVTQTWQGVSSISFVADETLKKQIERDKLCQTALVDVIPELCFNSIKHGKASEVMVSIEKSSPKTILLKVSDNGQKVAVKSNKGLGTKLLDECAISWKREKAKDLVVTSAEFAISA